MGCLPELIAARYKWCEKVISALGVPVACT
jgi:hypothetical protein